MSNLLKSISITAALASALAAPHANAWWGCSNYSGGSGTTTPDSGICEGEVTWDFRTSSNKSASTHTGGDFEYTSMDASASQVTLSGWNESNGDNTALSNADSKLYHWGQSGLGIYESSSPQHGVDNNGADEFILFTFEEEVSLVCYSFGWPSDSSSTDYDSTLAYWDGDSLAGDTQDPDGLKISELGTEGWKLAGDYVNNAPTDYTIINDHARLDASADTAAKDIYSKYWIVGAYMANFPGSTLPSNYGNNDYFKLSSISVVKKPDTPPPGGEVPVPAPLALMAAGLFLLRKKFT